MAAEQTTGLAAPEFAGKVALVVGGSSGIGLASARLLARRGARVAILADRGVDEAAAAAAADGIELQGITADASIAEAVQAAVRQLVTRWGGLHITVHTAAIHPYANAGDMSEALWDRVMAVNLKSVYLLAHHALPQMLRQGEGAIVNLSSIQATSCQRDVCAYSVSKAAILAFTRSLAVDYSGRGIRANSVSPGSINTPMLDLSVAKFSQGETRDQVHARWSRGVPAGRIGTAEEIAEMVAFAASPRASYCNGANFVADGALSIQIPG